MSSEPEVSDSDIAIVGMSLRVPGAANPRAYWRNLRAGRVAVRRLTDEELVAAGVPAHERSDPHYVPFAAPLEGVGDFDGEFFGFGPKEAAILDPQHRHFYECAWEALEDAGWTPESFPGAIGVFGGCGMPWYFVNNVLTNPGLVDSVGLFLLRHTGNDKDFLATRVSYTLDLRGPAVNVQTACSTSLVAVHLACQSLLSGECDMALAGGVTLEIPHGRGYVHKEGEILSPDGICRPFDRDAKGTVFGSGAGVVVLRRLADALADGDPIHAIVKGSAVNNDGSRKVGYLAPSVDGQAAAIVEALAVSGCKPESIVYVEAHGTGTAVGDPIEIAALTEAYRRSTKKANFCGVGSVKANIGHLDTAAGVASLVKAVLALEAREIPPTPNFTGPNPTIDFASTPFYVASELRPMPRTDAPARVGVTSLGVGGTNAHVVLEAAPAATPTSASKRPYQLLCLSGRTRTAVDGNARRLVEHLRETPDANLADVAWTLVRGRRAFPERRVVAVRDASEAIALLESGDTRRVFTATGRKNATDVAFLFPGGGAQHVAMGAGLYRTELVVRDLFDRAIAFCRQRFGLDLARVFFPPEGEEAAVAEELLRPSIQLPAIFVVEYALAQLWASLGVVPKALAGHSMGENTAACIAGVASFEDTLTLVRRRGELFERVVGGGMLSISASRAEIEAILPPALDLATVNAPGLCVASGPAEAIAAFAGELARREIDAKVVPIAVAAHSRLLDPILDDFRAAVRAMRLSPPRIPFVSNLTGTWITPERATDPEYWVEHLRGTVRFAECVETLFADESRVLLEVGPGKVLSSLVRAQASFRPGRDAIPTMRHPDEVVDDAAAFVTAFGRLWAAGVPVERDVLWKGETRRRVSLPTYAFDHRHCWIEPGRGAAVTTTSDEPQRLDDVDAWFRRPAWREEVLDPPTAETAVGTWLVFLDRAGVAAELARRLVARGARVVTVRDGDAFARLSDDAYVVSPEYGKDGYDALVSDLVAHGRAPNAIVHAWSLTKDESFRMGSSFFHRNQEHGFYSLLFLAQALADHGGSDPVRLFVVSNGMQRVGREVLRHPDKATILGPCRVIPRELTHVACTSVDLPLRDAPGRSGHANGHANGVNGATGHASHGLEADVDALETEVLRGPCTGTVAWRDGRRFVERWERARVPASPTPDRGLRVGGTYLVTGGLGGIGLEVARWLATSVRARLVLLSRTGLPPREDWERVLATAGEHDDEANRIRAVLELERAGADVLVSPTDVTDVDGLDALADDVRTRFGRIDGVFHAAGVLRDGLLQTRTQMDVEEVFTPKVHGTLALERLLDRFEPESTVVFSSTSASLGPAGQIDYAAANAFLEAWAESRSSRGRPTVAIAWGVWKQIGMAARAASGAEAGARGTRTRSRLLSTWRREAAGHHVFEARWSARSHWMLDEHRTLDGRALLPGTGYLDLARIVLEEIGEDEPFELVDLVFLEPLFVPEEGGVDVRVDLRTGSDEHTWTVTSRSASSGGWTTHAEARVRRLTGAEAPRVALEELVIGTHQDDPRALPTGTAGVQAERLRFGARWRVLRARRTGERVAFAEIALDDAFHDDLDAHGLHPALLDVALHVAVDRIGRHERDLWVPMSFDRIRVHARLTPRIAVRVTLREARGGDEERATFDATVVDPEGRTLLVVEGFGLRHLGRGFAAVEARENRPAGVRESPTSREAASPLEAAFRRNLERGIAPAEGIDALARVVANLRSGRVLASSLDVEALDRQMRSLAVPAASPEARFERPELGSAYVPPRDDVERTLVEFWQELLGVDPVGVRDDFFALGGHSLIAVRLFTRVKKAFHVEFPISVLFEAPTIERCAELVRAARGPAEAAASGAAAHVDGTEAASGSSARPRLRHVVAMHSGEPAPRTPFFLVAGMFGNVLNLRHLAHLVGGERPFYGVQAKGLYGEDSPHETFEEMAAAYLAEIRTIQPRGPYLLGGFSGGGIAAYEMARQLLAAGEDVAALVMLDTPLPKRPALHVRDKILIHVQRARKHGVGYWKTWLESRARWKHEQEVQRAEAEREDVQGASFHSRRIQSAFTRALDRYDVARLPLRVTLFRPRLEVEHDLGGGRVTNVHRELLFHDNGWTPFVDGVDVHQVPGDHDSMVLEPNVRILAQKVRRALEAADRRTVRRREVPR